MLQASTPLELVQTCGILMQELLGDEDLLAQTLQALITPQMIPDFLTATSKSKQAPQHCHCHLMAHFLPDCKPPLVALARQMAPNTGTGLCRGEAPLECKPAEIISH